VIAASAVTGISTLGGVVLTQRLQSSSLRAQLEAQRKDAREQQRLAIYREYVAETKRFEHFMERLGELGPTDWPSDMQPEEGVQPSVALAHRAVRERLWRFFETQADLFLYGEEDVVNESSELELMAYEIDLALFDVESESVEPWASTWEVWSDFGGWARWGSAVGNVVNAMRSDVSGPLARLTTLTPSESVQLPSEIAERERGLFESRDMDFSRDSAGDIVLRRRVDPDGPSGPP
jgi:hypothetical protein